MTRGVGGEPARTASLAVVRFLSFRSSAFPVFDFAFRLGGMAAE